MVCVTGPRFENLVACHLLKQIHWQQDAKEKEVDFCFSDKTNAGDTLTHLIECKLSDVKPHRALTRFAEQWQGAQAIQVVRSLRSEYQVERIRVRQAASWLMNLDT
jgi:uncharacterized protein